MKHLKHREKKSARFAVCLNNSGYRASLELHKIYRIIPDEDAAEDGDIRIVDESGEDYLYPARWFVLVRLPQPVKLSLLKAALVPMFPNKIKVIA